MGQYISCQALRWRRTLLVRGATKFVIDTMAEVIHFVVHYLEKTVLMTVSRKKSNTIASKPSIANATAAVVHDEVVKAASHAKVLGVGTVGGCKRCTFQQRSRIWKQLGCSQRFLRCEKSGLTLRRWFARVRPH